MFPGPGYAQDAAPWPFGGGAPLSAGLPRLSQAAYSTFAADGRFDDEYAVPSRPFDMPNHCEPLKFPNMASSAKVAGRVPSDKDQVGAVRAAPDGRIRTAFCAMCGCKAVLDTFTSIVTCNGCHARVSAAGEPAAQMSYPPCHVENVAQVQPPVAREAEEHATYLASALYEEAASLEQQAHRLKFAARRMLSLQTHIQAHGKQDNPAGSANFVRPPPGLGPPGIFTSPAPAAPTAPAVPGATQAPVSTDMQPSPPLAEMNAGSMLHGTGTCKPCLFWASQSCTKGTECEYCHFKHPQKDYRKIRPSKVTRAKLRKTRNERDAAADEASA